MQLFELKLLTLLMYMNAQYDTYVTNNEHGSPCCKYLVNIRVDSKVVLLEFGPEEGIKVSEFVDRLHSIIEVAGEFLPVFTQQKSERLSINSVYHDDLATVI